MGGEVRKMEEKRFLTDDEICREIKAYVEEDIYPYAIMLDGEWGCGKSFFIENTLRNMFVKDEELTDKRFIYVSLYGISSVEALKKAINNAYYKENIARGNNDNNKLMDALMTIGLPAIECFIDFEDGETEKEKEKSESTLKKKAFKAATDLVKNTIVNLDKVKEWLVQLDRCFFVFDDLERCCIPVTEVLGYINRLIEHSGCKVLIVANEKECGKAAERNQELKMIAAKNLESFIGKKPLSLEDIKVFSEEQFGMNRMYKRTKEKLIGQTIAYKVQVDQAVPDIVMRHLNRVGEHNQRLISEEAIRAMQDERVYNLRLLQVALSGYMKFYEDIECLKVDSDVRDDIVKAVLYAMVRTVFRKNAAESNAFWKIEWEGDGAYKEVVYLNKDWEEKRIKRTDYENVSFFSFKFIHDYVVYQMPNKKMARETLNMYADQKQKEKNLYHTAYAETEKGWWKFTDEEYKKTIETMEKELEEGKYPIQIGLKILRRVLFAFETFHIGHPDEVVKTLSKLANEEEKYVYIIEADFFISDDDISEKAKKQYKDCEENLQNIMKSKKKCEIADALNHFDEDDWSKYFKMALFDQAYLSTCEITRCVLINVDIDGLVQAIARGSAEDIVWVDRLLNRIYKCNEENYRGEKSTIGKLIEGLNQIETHDQIKEKVLKTFIEKLNGYESRMR